MLLRLTINISVRLAKKLLCEVHATLGLCLLQDQVNKVMAHARVARLGLRNSKPTENDTTTSSSP